jgi:uncharacterized repeat protein (TIGR01451 family)
MKKTLITLSTLATLTFLATGIAVADVKNCKPVYGGGNTCVQAKDFTIDKRIQNPKTQQFVDNLAKSDPNYNAESTITFALTVKNIGKNALSNMTITDTLPKYLEFVSGQGNYDKAKHTLVFPIAALAANEEKTFIIKARVAKAESLPNTDDVICMANLVQAQVNNTTGADNAQFCVQKAVSANPDQTGTSPTKAPVKQPATTKGGLPVMSEPKSQTTPATGPEGIALLALIPSGISGFLLRKHIRRS